MSFIELHIDEQRVPELKTKPIRVNELREAMHFFMPACGAAPRRRRCSASASTR